MKLKGGQISKNQKSKALKELKDKGLIIVERSPGRNPVVQIQNEYRQDDYYSKCSSITLTWLGMMRNESAKLERQVWRSQRPSLSTRVHPDLLHLLQEVAAENNWPLSVAVDEILYTGFKQLGKI